MAMAMELDGAYTKASGEKCQLAATYEMICGDLLKLVTAVGERGVRFSEHCWGSKNKIVQNDLHLEPTQEK